MKLLTTANRKALPPLYANDGKGMEALAVVKFFDPTGSWSWFATEANAVLADDSEVPLRDPRAKDAVDVRFFGLVDGHEAELGYFSLNELLHAKDSIRGMRALPIERDLHWRPTPLKDIPTNAGRRG